MTQLELMTTHKLSAAARVVGYLLSVNCGGETISGLTEKSGLCRASIYLRVAELEAENLITGVRQPGDTRRTLRWVSPEASNENT